MNTFAYIILLKLYAVFMLIGSGVLWFVFVREQYKVEKDLRLWAYFGFIIIGLFLSIYFIDGWQPLIGRE